MLYTAYVNSLNSEEKSLIQGLGVGKVLAMQI